MQCCCTGSRKRPCMQVVHCVCSKDHRCTTPKSWLGHTTSMHLCVQWVVHVAHKYSSCSCCSVHLETFKGTSVHQPPLHQRCTLACLHATRCNHSSPGVDAFLQATLCMHFVQQQAMHGLKCFQTDSLRFTTHTVPNAHTSTRLPPLSAHPLHQDQQTHIAFRCLGNSSRLNDQQARVC